MKKSFPVNINGTIFYIDEDAYQLLNTYLEQLRSAFPGDEGNEIIADIEARISEIFSETIANGAGVIVLRDVNQVIEQMGRPADLGNADSDEQPESHDSHTEAEAETGPTTPPPFNNPVVRKRLYRNESNKVFGGVLSGLACYLGWNANTLRKLIIVLWIVFVFTVWQMSWSLVILYILAWMFIPPAQTAQQYLEMTGTPVTVGNVGQTILGSASPNGHSASNSFMTNLLSIIGKIILIMFGLVTTGCAIGFLVLLIISICGLILYSGWNDLAILRNIDIISGINPTLGGFGLVSLALAVLIPCIAIIWGACCALFKVKAASKNIIISSIVLEIVLITSTVLLFALASIHPFAYCMAGIGKPATTFALTLTSVQI